MKNEIIEYLNHNKDNLQFYIEETKNIITSNIITVEPNILVFMSILEFVLQEKITQEFLGYLSKNFNLENLNTVKEFVSEEKDGFLEIYNRIKTSINNSNTHLVDIEWKFIGLLDLNANDLREMNPKILLKLIFSNDSFKIIETNFSNLKKFSEELEETISSYNSIYAKRIINFSK